MAYSWPIIKLQLTLNSLLFSEQTSLNPCICQRLLLYMYYIFGISRLNICREWIVSSELIIEKCMDNLVYGVVDHSCDLCDPLAGLPRPSLFLPQGKC